MALTPMTKQEFLEACQAHALGALDPEDRERFYLALPHADAEMNAALNDALHTAELLSLTQSAVAPRPDVKRRLMAQIHAEAAGAAPARRFSRETRRPLLERIFGAWMQPRLGLAAAFSLVVLAAGLVAYTLSLNDQLTARQTALADAHGRMEVLADSTRARIESLEDSLSRKEAMLEVLRARGMQMVALGGMEDTARYGKILWDPERKVAVLQVSLPPEPEGMDYQLWVIRDSKPMAAGVFQVSARSGDGMYRIEQLVETDKKHINAFAVTLEPAGGMPQPTGKMYLMGEI
ncbi:MAG: Anti-sigma-K factor rskA [Fibrobacteria bacterium]|nr:Anti-sigma-K factor rskA [Fibrobacteria bacterium]